MWRRDVAQGCGAGSHLVRKVHRPYIGVFLRPPNIAARVLDIQQEQCRVQHCQRRCLTQHLKTKNPGGRKIVIG